MSKRFWYATVLIGSLLWAVLVWAGYRLLMLGSGVLDQGAMWWAAYPEVQAMLMWLGTLAQGFGDILGVLALTGWVLGQLCLLAILWLGLRFGTRETVQALGQQLQQRARALTAPVRDTHN